MRSGKSAASGRWWEQRRSIDTDLPSRLLTTLCSQRTGWTYANQSRIGPDEWEDLVDYDDPEADPIEQAIVVTYEDGRRFAYRSKTERDYVENREELWRTVI